jgi:hypothetical protein
MFFICLSCYRGQTYCSAECRQKTRREQLRQANRRYQRSLEARLDHRDRQSEYRRRRFCRVTDQSSPAPSSCGRIDSALALVSTPPASEQSDDLRQWTRQTRFHRIFCIVCGRWGHFIEICRARR